MIYGSWPPEAFEAPAPQPPGQLSTGIGLRCLRPRRLTEFRSATGGEADAEQRQEHQAVSRRLRRGTGLAVGDVERHNRRSVERQVGPVYLNLIAGKTEIGRTEARHVGCRVKGHVLKTAGGQQIDRNTVVYGWRERRRRVGPNAWGGNGIIKRDGCVVGVYIEDRKSNRLKVAIQRRLDEFAPKAAAVDKGAARHAPGDRCVAD